MRSYITAYVILGLAASAAAADLTPRQRVAASEKRVAIARRQNVPEDCTFFDSISSSDQGCDDLASTWGISTQDFISWNPDVGQDCSNIVLGKEYCVERNWGVPISSTTTAKVPGPTSTVPSPTQSGIIEGCKSYYQAVEGDDCSKIIAAHGGFSLGDFIKWNPAVGSGCSQLWLGYWYCVAVEGTPTKTSFAPSSTTTSGNGIQTPTPIQPGMTNNCNKFHLIKDTTTCQGIADYNKVSLKDILKWNSGLNAGCTNLWLGSYACAGVIGGQVSSLPAPTTTTSAGNGIATPTPTQSGIVSNCNKFHVVKDTTTCQGMADYNKVSVSNILKWNTGLNKDCTNLWLGTYACVGIISGTTLLPTRTTMTTTTTFAPGNGIATPSPIQAGMVPNCNKFHVVKQTTTCQGMADYNKVSIANILRWNTGLNKDCSNLWLGTHACVGVIGGSTAPTTTTTSSSSSPNNGIATPTPTQPGMVNNCNKFHLVKSTTTCQGLADYNKVSLANVKRWNTGLNSACSNLWLGTYACVGVVQARMQAFGLPSSRVFNTSSVPGLSSLSALSSLFTSTRSIVEVPEETPTAVV